MKIKVDFVWFGITGRYGIWKDGLWAAMQILEKEFDVEYKEPTADIRPDAVVLLWEAPCTINHPENGIWYKRICDLPNKKALLFAGGPLKQEWMWQFDHVFVESAINAEECDVQGVKHSTAFGINSDIFKPMEVEKIYDVAVFGTCASWKRQGMIGKAIKNKMVVAGRGQESDPQPFIDCTESGCKMFNELQPHKLNELLAQSHCIVNGADFWGGGQRVTLEAMSAGIPVICMSDSPKNIEYVEESGFGLVCEPNEEAIKNAVNSIKEMNLQPSIGRKYVESKWTPQHYADSLSVVIKELCLKSQS